MSAGIERRVRGRSAGNALGRDLAPGMHGARLWGRRGRALRPSSAFGCGQKDCAQPPNEAVERSPIGVRRYPVDLSDGRVLWGTPDPPRRATRATAAGLRGRRAARRGGHHGSDGRARAATGVRRPGGRCPAGVVVRGGHTRRGRQRRGGAGARSRRPAGCARRGNGSARGGATVGVVPCGRRPSGSRAAPRPGILGRAGLPRLTMRCSCRVRRDAPARPRLSLPATVSVPGQPATELRR